MRSPRPWVQRALVVCASGVALSLTGCGGSTPASEHSVDATPTWEYTVVTRHPHDSQAFTQGLLWHRGALWESLGGYGTSELRRVRLRDGAVTARRRLGATLFGEGIALVGNTLRQLTWREQVVLRWDARTLRAGRPSRIAGEGWGATTTPQGDVLTSDGSARLTWRDPHTMRVLRSVLVRNAKGEPVTQLNELEWVHDVVLANVWQSPRLVVIRPSDGALLGEIDLGQLWRDAGAPAGDPDAVPNGVAFRPDADGTGGTLLVTGKRWPTLYELRVPRLDDLMGAAPRPSR